MNNTYKKSFSFKESVNEIKNIQGMTWFEWYFIAQVTH